MATPHYKVIMTTREQLGVYGNQIDITEDVELTDYIKSNGISTMKIEADDGDYTVGVFVIGDLTLKTINYDGKFSDNTNWRSLFPYARDLTKVDVIYVDESGAENTRFKGLITEEATKEDLLKNEVKLKVLNQQGILRKSTILPGLVRTGMTFEEAFFSILNRPVVTSILNFNESNINPQLNLTLDDESFFNGISAYEGIIELLQASNSIMTIDGSNNIIIRDRTHNSNTPFAFYGGNDYYGRSNIIKLTKYNSGLQRTYNTIKVGDYTYFDDSYLDQYDGRQKELSFDFIIDRKKSLTIAKAIVEEFKTPKYEMEITVLTEGVKDIKMFDLCTVDISRRIAPRPNAQVPLYEQAQYGVAKYPYEVGNLAIPDTMGFKVTAIRENPSSFTTQLRLREIGTTIGDGFI